MRIICTNIGIQQSFWKPVTDVIQSNNAPFLFFLAMPLNTVLLCDPKWLLPHFAKILQQLFNYWIVILYTNWIELNLTIRNRMPNAYLPLILHINLDNDTYLKNGFDLRSIKSNTFDFCTFQWKKIRGLRRTLLCSQVPLHATLPVCCKKMQFLLCVNFFCTNWLHGFSNPF